GVATSRTRIFTRPEASSTTPGEGARRRGGRNATSPAATQMARSASAPARIGRSARRRRSGPRGGRGRSELPDQPGEMEPGLRAFGVERDRAPKLLDRVVASPGRLVGEPQLDADVRVVGKEAPRGLELLDRGVDAAEAPEHAAVVESRGARVGGL